MDALDVRVYMVHCVFRCETTSCDIEFQTTVNQPVNQEIPINNTTNEDWSLRAVIQASYFHCPQSFVAKAQSKSLFPITFNPLLPTECQGSLQLINSSTSQRYFYKLLGHATDYLPESSMVIDCEVMKKYKHGIILKNCTDCNTIFDVITDIPFSFGESQIEIAANSSAEYELHIQPKLSGKFSKVIEFINRNDKSITCHTVELNVGKSSEPEGTIEIKCSIGKVATASIEFENRSALNLIEYDVTIDGPNINGDDKIILQPKEKKVYLLRYQPCK